MTCDIHVNELLSAEFMGGCTANGGEIMRKDSGCQQTASWLKEKALYVYLWTDVWACSKGSQIGA